MYSLPILILCALLQSGSEGTAAPRLQDMRQPAAQQVQTPSPPVQTVPNTPPPVPTAVAPPAVVPPVVVPSANTNQILITNCTLELPKRSRFMLSAPVSAVLEYLGTPQQDSAGNSVIVPITEGMTVSQGQVLGNLNDLELRSLLKIGEAQLDVAKAEADKKIEVKVAAHALQLAMAEVITMEEANKEVPTAFPKFEVERARMAQLHAAANLDLQKYLLGEIKTREVVVRESELDRTQVQIDLRRLTAEIDGVIVDIKVAKGEYLREGDPILEIWQLDTMWVKVTVDAGKYSASDLDGKRATVRVPLANGKMETFQGAVVFCNPKIDQGNTFWAYIEVQNRRAGNYWLLQPGSGGVDIMIPL